MFESLFGAEMPLPVRFFIAFLIVLALIAATAWAVRRFGADRLGAATSRGRQPRLAVIDAAAVDGRRRLVLIRRDNIEHLLMIGGPSDLVIEPNIVRAAAAPREQTPPARAAAADTLPRSAPLDTPGNWPIQPEPAAAPRLQRTPPPAEEPASWPAEPELPPAPPPPRRQTRATDPLAGLAAELTRGGEPRIPMPGEFGGGGLVLPRDPPRQRESTRESVREREPQMEREPQTEREPIREREPARGREPARELMREPMREPVREREPPRLREPQPPPAPVPVEEEFDADADQNLADMAQRLEAALRRPGKGGEPRPAESAPRAAAANGELPATPPVRAPAVPEAAAPRADVKPARSLYDSLEKEMASLLGRPGGKS